jgi:HAD superfamily hydrolase (TIGR01662 family)
VPAATYDAYLFDAGGVLVLPDPTVIGPLLAVYGGDLSPEAHRRAHYAGMAEKSRAGAAETEWAVYDQAYVVSIGVSVTDRDEAAMVLGVTRSPHLWRWPIPDSVTALIGLHERGYPLGVVSNASGQVEAALRRAVVCQVGAGSATPVRCVIDSTVVGVAKPDPRIFDHALAHFAGIEPSRIAYVGDSVTMDIASSKAAGLSPILLDPFDDHPHLDVRRVSALTDLLHHH